jgi:hypothetical protein
MEKIFDNTQVAFALKVIQNSIELIFQNDSQSATGSIGTAVTNFCSESESSC